MSKTKCGASLIVVAIFLLFTSAQSYAQAHKEINGCEYSVTKAPRFTVDAKKTDLDCDFIKQKWLDLNAELPISFWLGGERFPYYAVGRDIAEIMKCKCMVFDPITSTSGSNNTINKIASNKDAKFGIVQADLLTSRMSNKGVYGENVDYVKKKIRVIGRLFPEYVHVIARKNSNIDGWTGLAEKTVHVGEPGSGTYFTASILLGNEDVLVGKKDVEGNTNEEDKIRFDLHSENLLWNKIENRITTKGAINSLISEDVDAIFLVAGAPAQSIAEDLLFPGSPYELITIPELDHLPELYYERKPFQYPGRSDNASSYLTYAMLVTYNWKDGSGWCKIANAIHSSLESNLTVLRRIAGSKEQTAAHNADPNWLNFTSLNHKYGALENLKCEDG